MLREEILRFERKLNFGLQGNKLRNKMQMVCSREAALATETPVSVEIEGEKNFGVTVGR